MNPSLKRYVLSILGIVFAIHVLVNKPTVTLLTESATTRTRSSRRTSLRQQQQQQQGGGGRLRLTSGALSTSHKDQPNHKEENNNNEKQIIQVWRTKYDALCKDENSSKDDLLQMLVSFPYHGKNAKDDTILHHEKPPPPTTTTMTMSSPSLTSTIEPCYNVFLDFGANVGDSLGKFIDSGLNARCPNKGMNKDPKLDLQTMTYYGHEKVSSSIKFHKRDNPLIRSSRSILQEERNSQFFPEDYCYVGIEGNPRFTKQLQDLQDRIVSSSSNSSRPPPLIQKVHFLTETVGSGSDGPTMLYLDTINQENNFWGSSILPTHRDVQQSSPSASETASSAATLVTTTSDGTKKEQQQQQLVAKVQGITLSTLLQKAVQKVKGAHVLIKMDIEGGEFDVLEEAYQSGALCDYSENGGVDIHLILETHRPDVTGIQNFDLKHWQHVQKSLKDCGIIIKKGRDAGR